MDNETCDAIQTERISLRCVRADDIPALAKLMTPGVSRWLASWVSNEETVAAKIIEAIRAIAAREAVHFLVVRRADLAAIGYVRVARVPGSPNRGDLSYWIGEDYHGQGYATEAVVAAVGAAFESLDLASVEAGAQPENVASFAVMRRLGMERSEERIVHAAARDRDELCFFYSISRERFVSVLRSASTNRTASTQTSSPHPESFIVRSAGERDSAGIISVLEIVASERIFSAIDRPWNVEQERTYLRSLLPREATHVAVVDSGEIIGFQNLDLWAASVNSMSHVGQIGTFLLPEWRRRGVGNALFQATQAFARDSGYSKFVIQVRASNSSAQSFYKALGFRECGRFTRQVRIDGKDDDEIMMEYFL